MNATITPAQSYELRQRLLTIAKREIGVHETPKDSNRGTRVQEYQSACDYSSEKKTGWAWCAAFVCWCIREWLKDAEVRAALGLIDMAAAEKWRPKTAAAWGFKAWAEQRGLLVLNDSQSHTLHAADICEFDFSHVGFTVTDEGTEIYTIEGNTSPDNKPNRDGGEVANKVHQRRIAQWFIRLLP